MRTRTLSGHRGSRSTANISSASVVRAGPCEGVHVGRATHRGDDLCDEVRQRRRDKVSDDADALLLAGVERLLDVARHVLLQHGPHVAALALVRGKDGLRAEQAALLGRVPVEFDRVCGVAAHDRVEREQHAQGLKDGHRAAAVIVGAGGREDGGEE